MKMRWIALTLVLMFAAYTLLRVTTVDLLVAVGSAALLLAIGRRSGLSWADLGLARDTLGRGARWALVSAAVVAVRLPHRCAHSPARAA